MEGGRARRKQANRPILRVVPILLSHLLVGLACFHFGFVAGTTRSSGRIAGANLQPQQQHGSSEQKYDDTAASASEQRSLFPDTVRGLLVGTATVPRDDFIEQFDVGVPWDERQREAKDVILLYSSEASLPPDYQASGAQHYRSALEATQNCHAMKVILTKPNQKNECMALVGQWSSFHLHHFLRLRNDEETQTKQARHKVEPAPPLFRPDYPLRYVSRRHDLGGKTPQLPLAHQTESYWPLLVDYLQKLPATLERLRPLAAQVVVDNTIVVMVCNLGQSELLMNFVCAARARKLPLDRVLLFATDSDTYQLARSLGIAAFDVRDAFGDMPTQAAGRYGDKKFMGMMMAKVYCVHLVNALGYDLLFQDVDVVWYKDPVSYFHSKESKDFDFYFQDGTRQGRRTVLCCWLCWLSIRWIYCLCFALLLTIFFLLSRRGAFEPVRSLFPQFRFLLCTLQRSLTILFRGLSSHGRADCR